MQQTISAENLFTVNLRVGCDRQERINRFAPGVACVITY